MVEAYFDDADGDGLARFVTPGPVTFGSQIIGLPELRGVLRGHENAAVARLQEVVSRRSAGTKYALQEAMDAEYTSDSATGRLARSITYRTLRRPGGVESRFYIKAFRELEFVTSLFGGHFRLYPVGPYLIFPSGDNKSLWIKQDGPGGGRVSIRKVPAGQPVLWGKHTGGFSRDVLRDVSEEEAQFFLDDVYREMAVHLSELRTSVRRR